MELKDIGMGFVLLLICFVATSILFALVCVSAMFIMWNPYVFWFFWRLEMLRIMIVISFAMFIGVFLREM